MLLLNDRVVIIFVDQKRYIRNWAVEMPDQSHPFVKAADKWSQERSARTGDDCRGGNSDAMSSGMILMIGGEIHDKTAIKLFEGLSESVEMIV